MADCVSSASVCSASAAGSAAGAVAGSVAASAEGATSCVVETRPRTVHVVALVETRASANGELDNEWQLTPVHVEVSARAPVSHVLALCRNMRIPGNALAADATGQCPCVVLHRGALVPNPDMVSLHDLIQDETDAPNSNARNVPVEEVSVIQLVLLRSRREGHLIPRLDVDFESLGSLMTLRADVYVGAHKVRTESISVRERLPLTELRQLVQFICAVTGEFELEKSGRLLPRGDGQMTLDQLGLCHGDTLDVLSSGASSDHNQTDDSVSVPCSSASDTGYWTEQRLADLRLAFQHGSFLVLKIESMLLWLGGKLGFRKSVTSAAGAVGLPCLGDSLIARAQSFAAQSPAAALVWSPICRTLQHLKVLCEQGSFVSAFSCWKTVLMLGGAVALMGTLIFALRTMYRKAVSGNSSTPSLAGNEGVEKNPDFDRSPSWIERFSRWMSKRNMEAPGWYF
ncbi:hypothetical protein FVE85_1907 [Porphyridium purpureum]|uniref:Uncharacterized protein n=1 Tax=Porphyridium purpureum TaxID=35688 RepID=A0A5J4YY09_PORPP|nr:hypothetical protein FVE85_1907 [Porphyridium purpureum]|eukprot:POR6662..scf209_3